MDIIAIIINWLIEKMGIKKKEINELKLISKNISKYDIYYYCFTLSLVVTNDENFLNIVNNKKTHFKNNIKNFDLFYVDKKDISYNDKDVVLLKEIINENKSFTSLSKKIRNNTDDKRLFDLVKLIKYNKTILKTKKEVNMIPILNEDLLIINNNSEMNEANEIIKNIKIVSDCLVDKKWGKSKFKVGYIKITDSSSTSKMIKKIKEVESIMNNILLDFGKILSSEQDAIKKSNTINFFSSKGIGYNNGIYEIYIDLVHIYQFYSYANQIDAIKNEKILPDIKNLIEFIKLIRDNILQNNVNDFLNTIIKLEISNYTITKTSTNVICETIRNFIGPLIEKLNYVDIKKLFENSFYTSKVNEAYKDQNIENILKIQDLIGEFLKEKDLINIVNEGDKIVYN